MLCPRQLQSLQSDMSTVVDMVSSHHAPAQALCEHLDRVFMHGWVCSPITNSRPHTLTHTHTHTGYETLCVDIGRLWSTSLGQRQSNTWVLLVMCIWTLVEVCVCVSHLTLPCLARTGLVVCVCVCPTLPYLALQDEPGCVLHSMNKHWRAMWEWL